MNNVYNYFITNEIENIFNKIDPDAPSSADEFRMFNITVENGGTVATVKIYCARDEKGNHYPLISLIDQNAYNARSLTNNMEVVLTELANLLNISLDGVTIIYRDSMNAYDGVRVIASFISRVDKYEVGDIEFIPFSDVMRKGSERNAMLFMLHLNISDRYSHPAADPINRYQ